MADLPSPVPVTASNLPNWIRSAAIVINTLLRSVSAITRRPARTVAADYTVTADDYLIAVNAAGGNITVTLPTTANGKQYFVKRIDASANTVTVSGPIDGGTSVALPTQWAGVVLFGANGGFYAA